MIGSLLDYPQCAVLCCQSRVATERKRKPLNKLMPKVCCTWMPAENIMSNHISYHFA